jgi:hypothetical protein
MAVLAVAASPALAQYSAAAVAALNSDNAGVVLGQPMSMVEKTTDVTPVVGGAAITRHVEEREWRDSQGRFRRESTRVEEGQAAVYDRAVILDPVKNTATTLNLFAKTASVVHLQPGQLHPYVDPLQDKPILAMPGVQVKVEKLEGKTILGMYAVGRRVTRTRPPGTIGNDKTIVSVAERWVSPDLKIMLATSLNDPRELQTRTVTQLDRGEPDAGLFQVPDGFTVTEAEGKPMRQVVLGGHGGSGAQ